MARSCEHRRPGATDPWAGFDHPLILHRELRLGLSPRDLVRACRAAGVRNRRVLEAVAHVPRAGFVPPERLAAAYLDSPVPIAHDQVTTQPSLVARMVEALDLTGTERVLEVGAGLGWQTALLARLAAEVIAVERFADLAVDARANLERQAITGARVVVGDGSEGLAEHAPYDAIVVAAAFPTVPPPLVDQLVEGGRLVQPIGTGGAEDVMLFRKEGPGRLQAVERVSRAHFVRLYGRHGYTDITESGSAS